MKNIKHILAILIAVMATVMICIAWPNESVTGWMVALVGWLEVIDYQRNEK